MPQSNDDSLHQDPAYQEEAEKLADVVRYIEEQRLSLRGQMPATAAHQETANAIQRFCRRTPIRSTRPWTSRTSAAWTTSART